MRELSEIRNDIDLIDQQILELFEKRMYHALEVAEYKKEHDLPIFVPEREQEILNQKLQKLSDTSLADYAKQVFECLMDASKQAQKNYIDKEKQSANNEAQQNNLDSKNKVIAFQGVCGSNGEEAMLQYFPKDIESIACAQFCDVIQAVQTGIAELGVLPIENSTGGSVYDVYDLLGETKSYIVGEQILSIEHCLLCLPGTIIEEIETVVSHPQALLQCSKFISRYGFASQPFVNTASAAKMLSENKEKHMAVIASTRAATCYGLQILQQAIQDRKDNVTRFVIISRKPLSFSGKGKISLAFTLRHQSGSLYRVLEHFASAKLNLTKIESRVIPSRRFEYRFYMDFEGDVDIKAIEKTLSFLEPLTQNVQFLGAYLPGEEHV